MYFAFQPSHNKIVQTSNFEEREKLVLYCTCPRQLYLFYE